MKNNTTRFLQLNNFFDKGLYQEGKRQIKTFGIVCIALSAILALLMPLYMLIMIVYGSFTYYSIELIEKQITFNELISTIKDLNNIIGIDTLYFGFLTIILLIFVPIVCLILFHFLTKRKCCDYFHSFPQKRGCIYTSYLLAIITWIFYIVAAFTLAPLIIYIPFTYFFDVSVLYVLQYALYSFIAATLGAVTICMACAMTGTLFTNIIVSGIFLFIPRIFITAISIFMTDTADVFVSNHFTIFADIGTNLITSFITRIFTDLLALFGASMQLPNFLSFAYNLLLIAIYYFIGRYFFVKRESEAAGRPAESSFTRFIFRLCVGLPYALISVLLVLSNIYFPDGKGIDPVIFFFVVVLQIVGIATIFIYEMIASKAFNVIFKVLPVIPVYMIVQAFIILISCGIQYYELSYNPPASKVNSIVLKSFNEYEFINFEDDDYLTAKLIDKTYYNDLLKKFVCDELTEELNSDDKDDKTLDLYDYSNREHHTITVVINTFLKSKYRHIKLTDQEYDKFTEALLTEKDVKDTFLILPEYKDINARNSYWDSAIVYEDDRQTASFKNYKKIYNSLREEIKNVDPVTYFKYNRDYENAPFSLSAEARLNGRYKDLYLTITTLTPDTLLLYMNTVNDSIYNNFNRSYYKSSQIIVYNESYSNEQYFLYSEDFYEKKYEDSYTYDENNESTFNDTVTNVSDYWDLYYKAAEQIRLSSKEPLTTLNKEGYTLVGYRADYDEYMGYGYVETKLLEELMEISENRYNY